MSNVHCYMFQISILSYLNCLLMLDALYIKCCVNCLQVLYVMTLFQDRDESQAHVSSVSEFLLTQPCLSMAILDVGIRKFKKSELKNGLDGITTGKSSAVKRVEVGLGW